MYTRRRGVLPRLRAYHHELGIEYRSALRRGDWSRARRVRSLRHRVWVAIRWREEWGEAPPPLPTAAA